MKKAKGKKVANTPRGNTRGGVRVGAGRPRVDYTTTTKAFRIRTEIEEEFVRRVKELIEELTPRGNTVDPPRGNTRD